ncbi:MAG TPA: hypothetical protein VJM34_11660 [Novosphingobium sp.]|nr:hypothetical protein [Novosphingobium sp.]
MIDLVKVKPAGPCSVILTFSDGSFGEWDAGEVIARDTVLTRALADPEFFVRAFVESGALAWPNGLEFSARSLQHKLERGGLLKKLAA